MSRLSAAKETSQLPSSEIRLTAFQSAMDPYADASSNYGSRSELEDMSEGTVSQETLREQEIFVHKPVAKPAGKSATDKAAARRAALKNKRRQAQREHQKRIEAESLRQLNTIQGQVGTMRVIIGCLGAMILIGIVGLIVIIQWEPSS